MSKRCTRCQGVWPRKTDERYAPAYWNGIVPVPTSRVRVPGFRQSMLCPPMGDALRAAYEHGFNAGRRRPTAANEPGEDIIVEILDRWEPMTRSEVVRARDDLERLRDEAFYAGLNYAESAQRKAVVAMGEEMDRRESHPTCQHPHQAQKWFDLRREHAVRWCSECGALNRGHEWTSPSSSAGQEGGGSP